LVSYITTSNIVPPLISRLENNFFGIKKPPILHRTQLKDKTKFSHVQFKIQPNKVLIIYRERREASQDKFAEAEHTRKKN